MANVKIFRPCEEIFLNILKSKNYGVLVLNSPTKLVDHMLWNVWNQGKIRVLVDGGSESWISWINSPSKEKCDLLPPHLVTGDFDSITPETLEKFKKNEAIQVIHTPNQDETDFTKALTELSKYQQQNNIMIKDVYVLTTVGGRMDHLMANINTLYRAYNMLPNVSVFLLCSDSISWLLKPGTYTISIPELLRNNKEWCGLIPVGSPAVVTTSGLKWNLRKTKMEFGELVSTSNTYDGSPEVNIETNSSILWTMGIKGFGD